MTGHVQGMRDVRNQFGVALAVRPRVLGEGDASRQHDHRRH
jgi:hypothetical protein